MALSKRRPTILSNRCFERDYYNSFWFISRWFNSWHAIVIDYSNLIPIIIVAALIILGLWLAPKGMIKGFQIFGQGVVIVAIFGLVVGAIQLLLELQ